MSASRLIQFILVNKNNQSPSLNDMVVLDWIYCDSLYAYKLLHIHFGFDDIFIVLKFLWIKDAFYSILFLCAISFLVLADASTSRKRLGTMSCILFSIFKIEMSLLFPLSLLFLLWLKMMNMPIDSYSKYLYDTCLPI